MKKGSPHNFLPSQDGYPSKCIQPKGSSISIGDIGDTRVYGFERITCCLTEKEGTYKASKPPITSKTLLPKMEKHRILVQCFATESGIQRHKGDGATLSCEVTEYPARRKVKGEQHFVGQNPMKLCNGSS